MKLEKLNMLKLALNTLALVSLLVLPAVSTGCGGDDDQGKGGLKEVVLDSAGPRCMSFASGTPGTNCEEGAFDVAVEPWCTEKPGLCGDWAETTFAELDQVAEPPATGYITDGCHEVTPQKVIVFKLKNGKFAKGIITNDIYTDDGTACNHKITLKYVYPM
ncbi:MAG: hypothetical protein GXP49_01555 [Deltaproteobacteria bacterium]|nr:hypothetical protein [Deltaproteobacteria bacterium]